MRHLLLMIVTALMFSACSSSGKVHYAWQGQAKAYMQKYQEMMLKGDSFQADYYLKDAVSEAQNDVSLHSLAVVYLSQCAMNKAMGVKHSCKLYDRVALLVNNPKLQAYKSMISDETVVDARQLDKYDSFYRALVQKDVDLADIQSLDTIYAQAIAAMLVFEKKLVTVKIVDYMIDQASRENMKGLMLVWLNIAKELAEGERLKNLQTKIELLKSQE